MKSAKPKRPRSAPAAKEPAARARKDQGQLILLAVTGMSPGVLTETVWALAKESPPSIPDRVVVITTPRGKELLDRELRTPVAPGRDSLWQLLRREILGPSCEQHGSPLNLTINVISVPNPRTGCSEPLEDFRNAADNAAMADFLLAEVRALVEIPGARLIASIAGGRKTLGALLYACMSLLGRETDRLTHVLVTEPYDSPGLKPRFFFPTQPEQRLVVNGGKAIPASNARIDLGDIPFVPLRNLFERDLISKPYSFTELVDRCKQKVSEAARRNVRLTLWRSRAELDVNGVKIQTSAMQQVLMLFLADHAAAPARAMITKFNTAIEPLSQFAHKLRSQRPPNNDADWRWKAELPPGFDDESLRKLLNELKGKLKAAGSQVAALAPLLPAKGRFSLDLSPTAIQICD